MKTPKEKDFVNKETKITYADIDGMKVIEEYLLFKGTDHVRNSMLIRMGELEKMAHVEYGFKVNATNKLYVGMYLDKFYKRRNMIEQEGWNGGNVRIPKDIFERVDALHKTYKTKDNQDEE